MYRRIVKQIVKGKTTSKEIENEGGEIKKASRESQSIATRKKVTLEL